MEHVVEILRRELKSEVRSDHVTRRLYSTDASIYDVEPMAVFIPRTKGELVRAVEISSKYAVGLIPRGAATGIAGGCLGKGLVIDTSVHLNRVVEIDYANRFAVVQPGVVADRLNELLLPHGLYFAPEISTSNRATVGGMVASNAAGANSLEVGKIQDHVLEVELILWNGEVVRFSSCDMNTWKEKLKLRGTEGTIYRHLEHIRKEFTQDIQTDFPKTPRRASGYNLDVLIEPHHINVAALICGSEGTLGIISELKLKLLPIPAKRQMVVIGYNHLQQALLSTNDWLYLNPLAVEMIDKKIITAGKKRPMAWLEGDPDALVMWEVKAGEEDALLALARQHSNVLFAKAVDAATQKEVWDIRKSGLGLLLSKRSYSRAIAFIEDVAVPPAQVAPFTEKLQKLLTEYGKDAGIYGHIGAGCLHVRPYIDLRDPQELVLMQKITDQVAALLLEHGGVFSGEHGDGLARSWTTEKMFGPRLYEALKAVKHAFDPYGFMNPGKVVNPSQGLLEQLKLSPQMPIKEFSTYLDFSREGGFELAVDLCNGNGQCRKKEGVMCPSYQVTHEEKDSTRGRAQALRGLIHGQLPSKELFSDDFHSVMDLCIQCKGCKKECPSQVDMAKMKSEYLYHLHQKKSPSLRDRFFGHVTTFLRWASLIPWLSNKIAAFAPRKLPQLAQIRFSDLYKQPTNKTNKEVVLFVDSYTEFLTPNIGLAAVKLLEKLGYSVIAPSWHCCGRPLISKGFLPEAKKKLHDLVETFFPYAEKGIPIIALEPSCLSVLTDDMLDFHIEKAMLITKAVQPLASFLLSHKEELKSHLTECTHELLVHGHCHQKALFGMQEELMLLNLCAASVREIPSGCCGMAGSFGYEKEHIGISKKMAELVLFPAIRSRKSGSIIIASGNSCRSQIEDGLDIRALHFAEFLANQII